MQNHETETRKQKHELKKTISTSQYNTYLSNANRLYMHKAITTKELKIDNMRSISTKHDKKKNKHNNTTADHSNEDSIQHQKIFHEIYIMYNTQNNAITDHSNVDNIQSHKTILRNIHLYIQHSKPNPTLEQ